MAEVIVADRLTDANQKRIEVAALQVSWAFNEAGLIAFDIPVKDAIEAGVQPTTLLGKWLHYTHPTAGPWGGQVTNVLVTDGILSVSGESWASLLRGIVTDGVVTSGNISTTLKRLIDAATSLTGLKTATGSISHGGTALPFEFAPILQEAGNDLFDTVLPALLEYEATQLALETPLLPYGYNVDPLTRVFSFKTVIGTDRSATVKLADAVTNTGASWGDDLTDVVNTVTIDGFITIPGQPKKCLEYKPKKRGKPRKCKRWQNATPDQPGPATATGKNQASVTKYGPRSLRITTDANYSTQQNLQAQAQKLADAYAKNEQLATVKIARSPDELGDPAIFAAFREGDVVAVDLANEGGVGKMAVRFRALDVARGEMTVSGEAEIS